jgi:uncharacterized protein
VPRPRSPFVVGVTDELRHHGAQRPVRVAAPLAGLGISSARVPAGADVVVDIALESTVDGRITATGTVTAPWEGECRRCLGPVTGLVEAALLEVFEREPVDGDTYLLDHDVIDLEPLARDGVLLALPLAPLCADDCAGPAPDAHPVALGDDAEADLDPRWAALRDLRLD